MSSLSNPPPRVLVAAFSTATLAAAATGAALMQSASALAIALVVAALHALLIGLPAYLVLQPRLQPRLVTIVVVGFAISAGPISVLGLLSTPDSASVGGIQTVSGGMRTWAGFAQLIVVAAGAGIPGAVGGVVFWVTLQLLTMANLRRSVFPSTALLLVCLATGAAFFKAPQLTMDRTCHNPLRNGGRSISSQVTATLDVSPADWPEIRRVMREFADERGWSYRENEAGDPATYAALSVSVCNEAGTEIAALHHYSPEPALGSETEASTWSRAAFQMRIATYQPQGGDSWREPATTILGRIEELWGDRLTFQDQQGRDIPELQALEQPADVILGPKPPQPQSPAPPS